MYKHLQSIAAFVAVAESGAFNKAAERLGVRSSVISHHIAKLEEHLDVTLIHRTTRKLMLSSQGRVLFETAQEWIGKTQAVIDQIGDEGSEVTGSLRISVPAFIPDPSIEASIMKFVAIHPKVSLTLDYSDQVIDILDEGYDLSIRLGTPINSKFMRRKLSDIRHVLVASPDMCSAYEAINSPSDLVNIPYVNMNQEADKIILLQGNRQQKVRRRVCRIHVQNIYGVKTATVNGLGIGNLPESLCTRELDDGTLVRVLPDWLPPAYVMQAIWPDSSRRNSLTKRLVDHLMESKAPLQ